MTREKAEQELMKKASAVKRLLASPDGAMVMDTLSRAFYEGNLVGSTVEETYRNLGAREVVVLLRKLRDYGTERTGSNG